MATYKSFTHVEGLYKDACEGLLDNGAIYVSAKLDGTNACVWATEDGEVKCGSRKREICIYQDNAGFAQWVHSSNEEAVKLRNFVVHFPHLIVYGEWMGKDSFVGSIKDYDTKALGHFYIFDVFDTIDKRYLYEPEWRNLLEKYDLKDYFVKLLAILSNPTIEEVEKVAKENTFLLSNANHPGEGVVCKTLGWKNKYGHSVYGKLVLEEYKQNKQESKKVKIDKGEVEQRIVDLFLTDYELSKTKEKIVVACGKNKFDDNDSKMIARYLFACYHDAILEECPNWVKKFKNPSVNFQQLQCLAMEKARKYIGL